MFYSIIGIALLLLSAVTIACMVVFEVRDHKVGKPLPGKRKFQKPYSQAFLDAVPRAYESAGTLRGMLTLLVEQCPKENGRAKAALDYLNTVGTGTMKRHWLICQIPVLFVKNKSGRC